MSGVMSDAGFVKVYRSLLGHPAFRNDAEAMAFAWMVIRASWKAARVRYKDRAITLQRGQLAMSVRDMAAAMDRDKAWIERLWKRLKSETMIETATDAGVSVVTICNYATFQGEQDRRETASETPSETGSRQAQDTEQRREEIKEDIGGRTVEFWNKETAASPLPQARPLTADRLRHLKARVREHGEEAVFQAIRNMCASDFHSGRDGKWTEGNLGWLLKSPENFLKMLERQPPPRAQPNSQSSMTAQILARKQAA